MPSTPHLIAFALVALGMVLTPGPNMIYLISRSIAQGPKAGIISLGGVALGFLFYMLCAALGITALLMAVPLAYEVLKFAGAAYLLWMAWRMWTSPAAVVPENRACGSSTSAGFLMCPSFTNSNRHGTNCFLKWV